MRILHFRAKKVHGYIPIEMTFNEDLSLIVGSNGAGKTTALLLMQAILCPNFKDLVSIPFESIWLSILYKKNVINISVTDKGDLLEVKVDNVEETLRIEKLDPEKVEYLNLSHKTNEDINDLFFKNIKTHNVVSFIKSLPSPIFMGLDRTNIKFDDNSEDILYDKRSTLFLNRKNYHKYKRQFRGSLGTSLVETEMLVQDSYRRLSYIEEHFNNKLKDEILLSAFDYIPFNNLININSYSEKRNLLLRKEEIKDAFSKAGYSSTRFIDKLNTFFGKLEELLLSIEQSDKEGISIEWLTNYAQIDKLSKILDIIDDNTLRVNKAFEPVNKFKAIVNTFLQDSRKVLDIDKVGHINITRPDKVTSSIDSLSSGERQLVVLFANIIFNKADKNAASIFIIDEPELSLHIRWQEMFIDKMLGASQNTQFILATHSPDIIGDHKNKCIKVDNSSRYDREKVVF